MPLVARASVEHEDDSVPVLPACHTKFLGNNAALPLGIHGSWHSRGTHEKSAETHTHRERERPTEYEEKNPRNIL